MKNLFAFFLILITQAQMSGAVATAQDSCREIITEKVRTEIATLLIYKGATPKVETARSNDDQALVNYQLMTKEFAPDFRDVEGFNDGRAIYPKVVLKRFSSAAEATSEFNKLKRLIKSEGPSPQNRWVDQYEIYEPSNNLFQELGRDSSRISHSDVTTVTVKGRYVILVNILVSDGTIQNADFVNPGLVYAREQSKKVANLLLNRIQGAETPAEPGATPAEVQPKVQTPPSVGLESSDASTNDQKLEEDDIAVVTLLSTLILAGLAAGLSLSQSVVQAVTAALQSGIEVTTDDIMQAVEKTRSNSPSDSHLDSEQEQSSSSADILPDEAYQDNPASFQDLDRLAEESSANARERLESLLADQYEPNAPTSPNPESNSDEVGPDSLYSDPDSPPETEEGMANIMNSGPTHGESGPDWLYGESESDGIDPGPFVPDQAPQQSSLAEMESEAAETARQRLDGLRSSDSDPSGESGPGTSFGSSGPYDLRGKNGPTAMETNGESDPSPESRQPTSQTEVEADATPRPTRSETEATADSRLDTPKAGNPVLDHESEPSQHQSAEPTNDVTVDVEPDGSARTPTVDSGTATSQAAPSTDVEITTPRSEQPTEDGITFLDPDPTHQPHSPGQPFEVTYEDLFDGKDQPPQATAPPDEADSVSPDPGRSQGETDSATETQTPTGADNPLLTPSGRPIETSRPVLDHRGNVIAYEQSDGTWLHPELGRVEGVSYEHLGGIPDGIRPVGAETYVSYDEEGVPRRVHPQPRDLNPQEAVVHEPVRVNDGTVTNREGQTVGRQVGEDASGKPVFEDLNGQPMELRPRFGQTENRAVTIAEDGTIKDRDTGRIIGQRLPDGTDVDFNQNPIQVEDGPFGPRIAVPDEARNLRPGDYDRPIGTQEIPYSDDQRMGRTPVDVPENRDGTRTIDFQRSGDPDTSVPVRVSNAPKGGETHSTMERTNSQGTVIRPPETTPSSNTTNPGTPVQQQGTVVQAPLRTPTNQPDARPDAGNHQTASADPGARSSTVTPPEVKNPSEVKVPPGVKPPPSKVSQPEIFEPGSKPIPDALNPQEPRSTQPDVPDPNAGSTTESDAPSAAGVDRNRTGTPMDADAGPSRFQSRDSALGNDVDIQPTTPADPGARSSTVTPPEVRSPSEVKVPPGVKPPPSKVSQPEIFEPGSKPIPDALNPQEPRSTQPDVPDPNPRSTTESDAPSAAGVDRNRTGTPMDADAGPSRFQSKISVLGNLADFAGNAQQNMQSGLNGVESTVVALVQVGAGDKTGGLFQHASPTRTIGTNMAASMLLPNGTGTIMPDQFSADLVRTLYQGGKAAFVGEEGAIGEFIKDKANEKGVGAVSGFFRAGRYAHQAWSGGFDNDATRTPEEWIGDNFHVAKDRWNGFSKEVGQGKHGWAFQGLSQFPQAAQDLVSEAGQIATGGTDHLSQRASDASLLGSHLRDKYVDPYVNDVDPYVNEAAREQYMRDARLLSGHLYDKTKSGLSSAADYVQSMF